MYVFIVSGLGNLACQGVSVSGQHLNQSAKLSAQNPMLPPRLRQSPRILLITFCVTFVAGAQFTAILLLFPTQSYNQYGQDPIAVGIRGTVIGFSLLVGKLIRHCIIIAWDSNMALRRRCGSLAYIHV